MSDFPLLRAALASTPRGSLLRFLKEMGRAIKRWNLLRPDEGVLVGLSGGKDSLACLLGLSLSLHYLGIRAPLRAACVDWEEFPLEPRAIEALSTFCEILGSPFEILKASMARDPGKGRAFNCYACARTRKKLLFTRMEELGFRSLALGHHLDDMAATILMNLSLHARFECPPPDRNFFGRFRLIRPLCLVRESRIQALSQALAFPVASVDCPRKGQDGRGAMKGAVAEIAKRDRLGLRNMYEAVLAAKPIVEARGDWRQRGNP